MDDLLAWMSSAGTERMRPLFDRALAEGIANVPEAPGPLREFFETVEATPDWVDRGKLYRGQRALRRGGSDGMYIARDVSLLGGYQFSGFNPLGLPAFVPPWYPLLRLPVNLARSVAALALRGMVRAAARGGVVA